MAIIPSWSLPAVDQLVEFSWRIWESCHQPLEPVAGACWSPLLRLVLNYLQSTTKMAALSTAWQLTDILTAHMDKGAWTYADSHTYINLQVTELTVMCRLDLQHYFVWQFGVINPKFGSIQPFTFVNSKLLKLWVIGTKRYVPLITGRSGTAQKKQEFLPAAPLRWSKEADDRYPLNSITYKLLGYWSWTSYLILD